MKNIGGMLESLMGLILTSRFNYPVFFLYMVKCRMVNILYPEHIAMEISSPGGRDLSGVRSSSWPWDDFFQRVIVPDPELT